MRRRLLPLSLAPWALRVGVIAATIGLSACGGDGGGSAAGGPPSSGGTPPPTTPPTASAPAGSTGSAGAGVDPGGVRADGRSLDVTIRVAVPADVPGGSYFGEDSLYGLVAEDCAARDGDELTQLGPRCIQSADGRDISYSFGGINDRGVLKATDRAPHPTAVGLLIEQGDAGLSSTWMPNEPRLFSAKLFTDGLLPDTRVALAAFASDEASGSASSLPQRPVTFFPVQSPGFSTSKSEAFAVLQNLSSLVGGGARGDAPVDLEEKYGSQGFYLAKVPLSDLAVEGGYPLAVGVSRNQFSLAETADFNSPLELVRHWLAASEKVQDVRVRLTSGVDGAFAPGAVVKGQLLGQNPNECPWYCYTYVLPFRVEIPR